PHSERELLELGRERRRTRADGGEADLQFVGPDRVDRLERFPLLAVRRNHAEDPAALAFDAEITISRRDDPVIRRPPGAAPLFLEDQKRLHLAIAEHGGAFQANEVVRVAPDQNARAEAGHAARIGRFAARLEVARHLHRDDEIALNGTEDARTVELAV